MAPEFYGMKTKGELKMPFGKNKGKPLKELSNGYLTTLYLHQKEKLPDYLRKYIEGRSTYNQWLAR